MIEWASWMMFKFNGKTYVGDRIIFWDGSVIERKIKDTWHRIYPEEINEIKRKKPEILIIAKGWMDKLNPEFDFEGFGEIIVKNTAEAVIMFNESLLRGEKVSLLLHTTC